MSLNIAEENFQIISSDSVQVYRYLNIGSCKPSAEQRESVKHFLIDIVDPEYNFTAGDFCREADKACTEIFKSDKLPLFVGGCAFYVNAFFKGLSDIPPVSKSVRTQLKIELAERGLPSLFDELKGCDVDFAAKIHPNDRQRILRGLEVFRETGSPLSSYFSNRRQRESEDTFYIGIHVERNDLKERINNRVDEMMKLGFIDEVARLRERGYSASLKSMRSIGYRELNEYLDGGITLDDALQGIKTETRRYAKRQMTWYKKNKKIHWVSVSDLDKIKVLLYNWIDDKK